MNDTKPMPTKEGLRSALKTLKGLRERKPSEELVRIIAEVTEADVESEKKPKDRAARKPEPEVGQ